MSKKPRSNDLAGWLQLAAGSEAYKRQKKRRPANADFSTVKPSRITRRKGRGR
jgi:hypothetical protein